MAANNETPRDFRAESPDDQSFPQSKPGDVANYDDVFNAEERAVREHNLSVIKLELQRKKSEQHDQSIQQLASDRVNRLSDKSRSSGKRSLGQSSSRSQKKLFGDIPPVDQNSLFLNNISFEEKEDSKHEEISQKVPSRNSKSVS